jgi:hypothetical protein
MFLVQEVTKRPAAEVLNFFYELAGQVAEVGAREKMKSKRGRGIRKELTDYFPGTAIPFYMFVEGRPTSSGSWNPATKLYESDGEKFVCTAEVGFPEGRTYIKEDELKLIAEAIMEKALLDAPMEGIQVPEFKKPQLSTPKMYKKMMDSFMGREPEPKKSRKKKER